MRSKSPITLSSVAEYLVRATYSLSYITFHYFGLSLEFVIVMRIFEFVVYRRAIIWLNEPLLLSSDGSCQQG